MDPAHRGHGLARTLEALSQEGQDTDVVELTVPTRRAQDFDWHTGFVKTAIYPKRPLTHYRGSDFPITSIETSIIRKKRV